MDCKTVSAPPLNIAVVIPCYRVTRHIVGVISSIPQIVKKIYVIDDACPEESGNFAKFNSLDPRVVVLRHAINQGVGGAVMTGYKAAIDDAIDIVVKIDGDGQMDPSLIRHFVDPILSGQADYTKGNRFFELERVRSMPPVRIFGNAVLSFLNKFSSGYWDLFDPTNGYTAIHTKVAHQLPFDKISQRYFFETDMLFRLNTLRAVIYDIPMTSRYADEVSNLRVTDVVGDFFVKHMRNALKRVFYNYYLRDLSVASFELPIGLGLFLFGISFGAWHWQRASEVATPVGTVMLTALTTLMGLQLLLAFLAYDIASVPRRPINARLPDLPERSEA